MMSISEKELEKFIIREFAESLDAAVDCRINEDYQNFALNVGVCSGLLQVFETAFANREFPYDLWEQFNRLPF